MQSCPVWKHEGLSEVERSSRDRNRSHLSAAVTRGIRVQRPGPHGPEGANAKSERSKNIADMLKIPCVSYANKPGTSGVLKAMNLIGAKPENTVMIGDQVFTDMIAGNKAGLFTIFVERYSKKEVFYVVLKRFPEWILRKILRF